ncbi:hypothetical protein L7F22_036256 [Adiantum nelumboides]|nr:hypothetical protein [Adiantum nelumboides]
MDLEDKDEDDDEEEDDDKEGHAVTSGHPSPYDNDDDDQDQPGTSPSSAGAANEQPQPPASQSEPPSPAPKENEPEHRGPTGTTGGNQMQLSKRMIIPTEEYVAASEACKEAIWLTRLVGDLGIVREILVLHCDSQSAIQLARNPVFHAKTEHVDVRYHFIREVLEDKRLQLVKVHTDDNPPDLLTKSLSSERFTHCRELMGIG